MTTRSLAILALLIALVALILLIFGVPSADAGWSQGGW